MNSTNNLSIELDMNKFKKISKKLQSKIYDKTDHDIKLSIIQEALSESMGFRNFNDFKNQNTHIVIKKEDISSEGENFLFFNGSVKDNIKIIKTLYRITPRYDVQVNESIVEKFRSSIPPSSIMLLEILIENHKYFSSCNLSFEKLRFLPFLKSIFDNKVVENTDIFKQYFEYAFKSEKVYFNNETADLPQYCYEEDSQKRHDDSYNGLIRFLKIVNMIKNNDIVVYKRTWLITSNLNSRYGEVLYRDDIYKSHFYHKSWLHMESYSKLIANLDYLSPSSSFRMSDLLLHTANIIAPSLKDNMNQLISILINNYEDCIEISENFKNI